VHENHPLSPSFVTQLLIDEIFPRRFPWGKPQRKHFYPHFSDNCSESTALKCVYRNPKNAEHLYTCETQLSRLRAIPPGAYFARVWREIFPKAEMVYGGNSQWRLQ